VNTFPTALAATIATASHRTSSVNSVATRRANARNTSHRASYSRSSLLPPAVTLRLPAVLQPLRLSHPTPCRRRPHLVATAVVVDVTAQSCGDWDVWSCVGSGKPRGSATSDERSGEETTGAASGGRSSEAARRNGQAGTSA
jgi:hypothetical protein